MAAGLGNVQRPGMQPGMGGQPLGVGGIGSMFGRQPVSGGQPMGPGGFGGLARGGMGQRLGMGGMDPYGYNQQAYRMSGLQGGYMRPPVFQGPQIDYSGLNLPHMQPPPSPFRTGTQQIDPLADLRRARFGSNQG